MGARHVAGGATRARLAQAGAMRLATAGTTHTTGGCCHAGGAQVPLVRRHWAAPCGRRRRGWPAPRGNCVSSWVALSRLFSVRSAEFVESPSDRRESPGNATARLRESKAGRRIVRWACAQISAIGYPLGASGTLARSDSTVPVIAVSASFAVALPS